MAFTSTDVETLEAAIVSGTMRVSLDGRAVQYRSMDELLKAYDVVKRQVAATTNPSLRRGIYNPYFKS